MSTSNWWSSVPFSLVALYKTALTLELAVWVFSMVPGSNLSDYSLIYVLGVSPHIAAGIFNKETSPYMNIRWYFILCIFSTDMS